MNLIVVDIQPVYHNYILEHVRCKAREYIEDADNVTYYYNGACIGVLDKPPSICDYINIDHDQQKISFIEKEYGFYRDWMDSRVSYADIIRALRLNKGFVSNIKYGNIYTPDYEIPSYLQSKDTFICGGHDKHCLKEMELYLEYKANIRPERLCDAIF